MYTRFEYSNLRKYMKLFDVVSVDKILNKMKETLI